MRAYLAWYDDAIDVGLPRGGREARQNLRHLGGRDVLAFPPKCVANAVDEVREALSVPAQQIATAEENIA